MRWNKQELAALGAQPSHKFDKEGLLLFYDRHDGFFRRTESKYLLFISKSIPTRTTINWDIDTMHIYEKYDMTLYLFNYILLN